MNDAEEYSSKADNAISKINVGIILLDEIDRATNTMTAELRTLLIPMK